MAKSFHNDVFDNGLNAVKNNGNKVVLCKSPPTTFDEANNLDSDVPAGFRVAEVAMAPGDFTVADRTGGGRECTVSAKSGVTADDDAAAPDLHIAVIDTVNSKLLVVTDETSDQAITSGNTVNFPSWAFGFPDPV